MRVLQLIDSLRPGGAEQMAVAYANALSRRGEESFLCCTRMEGLLKKRLEPEVDYLFLEKRRSLDWGAFRRLRDFVREHQVDLIQAHSSSYFLAVLVKLAVPGLKLVWHDHYGKDLKDRNDPVLKWMSRYFDGIISVNAALKEWAQEHLKVSNVVFIKNFLPNTGSGAETQKLRGTANFKIICVANLRPQKDHLNLFKAFELLLEVYPDISLHLVGKDENDSYSQKLKSYVLENDLQEYIFFYGEQENVEGLIKQADIGVLSSSSEGLPIALLEYGRVGIPVVCTKVGEIPQVIGDLGQVVESEVPSLLAEGLQIYFRSKNSRERDAFLFRNRVLKDFSEDAIIPEVLRYFISILGPKRSSR